MKRLLIIGHLGMGDHLICNALYRAKAEQFDEVAVFVKHQNLPSFNFMVRDNPKIKAIKVDPEGVERHWMAAERRGIEVLKLGIYNREPLKVPGWDEQFYRQAGVPFQDRWDKFTVYRGDPPIEHCDRFTFLHDDKKRGFNIDRSRVTDRINTVSITEHFPTIFCLHRAIENAEEVHCIDSCFAILADSIPTKASRLVLHLYARPGAQPPTYRKKWEILR